MEKVRFTLILGELDSRHLSPFWGHYHHSSTSNDGQVGPYSNDQKGGNIDSIEEIWHQP
jgi:hypothetical protein